MSRRETGAGPPVPCGVPAARRRLPPLGHGVLPLLAGLGLLAGIVVWVGPARLVAQGRSLGWALPALLALGGLKHILRTWTWAKAMRAEGVELPFLRLLRVRLTSQAIAYLSSLGPVVSEPLKPWLLRHVAPVPSTVTATLAEATTYWMTALVVTTVGTVSGVHLLADGGQTLTLSLLCVLAAAPLAFLLTTSRSVLSPVAGWLRAWHRVPRSWTAAIGKAAHMESETRSFRDRHPRVFRRMLAVDAVVQLVMFAEVSIVLEAVGASVSIAALLAVEAASRLVKMLGFYVPGRLGADEAGAAGSFALLGLSPATGLALALARRAQGLGWTAVGLALAGRGAHRSAGAPSPRAELDAPALATPSRGEA